MAKSKATGHHAAGGIKSRNVTRKPVRTGQQRERVHVPGVNQLGNHVGDHVTKQGATGYRGESLIVGTGYKSQLGNAVALNVRGGGPGKGYVQYGQSGSQGCHGSPAKGNPTPRKALFPGWGDK